MKRTAWRWITHNLGWKLLSLIVSILLWLTVVAQPEMSTLQTLPVLYKNVKPDLVLVPGSPEVVRVEVRGPSSELSRANLAEAVVVLDLTGADEGSAPVFFLGPEHVRLPQGVTFVRATPSEVAVRLTPLNPKSDNRVKPET